MLDCRTQVGHGTNTYLPSFSIWNISSKFLSQVKNFSHLEKIFCLMRFSLVKVKSNGLNGKDF
jgi:hypothetical protein